MNSFLLSLISLSVVAASPLTSVNGADYALFRRHTNSSDLALNATAFVSGHGIEGNVNFFADENEVVTVSFHITGLSNLDIEGANASTQFAYHIHTNPIPSSGNCEGALGHLDPLHLTDALLCDRTQPQYCEEGDLAGKHGKLNFTASNDGSYQDPYLRFWPQPLSILGRSVVVHLPNLTRIACGNITSQLDGTADENGAPNNQSSTYVTAYAQVAAPAPSTSFHLFSSGTIDTALAAKATVPAALPDVNSIPDAVLTTTTLTSSAGGALVTSGFPAVVAAPSSFWYTPGPSGAAVFPTESQSFPSASSTSSAAPSGSGSTNSGSPAMGISVTLVALGFGALFSLIA